MKLKKNVLLFILFSAISCEKAIDEQPTPQPTPDSELSESPGNPIVLGKKLENPYTIDNMRKAYQNLMASGVKPPSNFKSEDLQSSHYYIWFKPQILRQLKEVRGFSESQIFNCLTSDVNNHTKLKNRLIQNYGQADKVNEASSFYGL